MADEDTTVEETDEDKTSSEETTEETDSTLTEEDYEAEAKTDEERGKPDPNKAQQAFKERQQNRTEGSEEDNDKPLTRGEATKLIGQVTSDTQKILHDQEADRIAQSLAKNDAEKRAILSKWRNRGFPTNMPLQEQLEEMHAAVNRKRLISTNAEIARALKNKGSVTTDTASTHRDPQQGSEPTLSAADKVGYHGYKWDGTRRLYIKPINGGKKHVIKDPVSKNSWVE